MTAAGYVPLGPGGGGGATATTATAHALLQQRGRLLGVLLAALLVAGLGSHLSWQSIAVSQLKQQLHGLHTELAGIGSRDAASHQQTHAELAASRQALAGLAVDEAELAHVGRVGSGCASLNPNASGLVLDAASPALVAPIVIVAHNRPGYLARAMVSLLSVWGADAAANAAKFPLFISIDGAHAPTLLLALALRASVAPPPTPTTTGSSTTTSSPAAPSGLQVIRNLRSASHCAPGAGHCNLAVHYAMLVELFFGCLQAPRLIFLEEDLLVAPDFLSYFEATAPLLDADPSLLCVSAWNDHGQAGRAANASALYRTDVLPGLGWMLNAAAAAELAPGWPDSTRYGGWDEYLRAPCVRRRRQCVFPEVPRSHTFGAVGNSGGMFYEAHLANMVLADEPVAWRDMDLSFLKADNYAALMDGWLAAAVPLAAAAAGAGGAAPNTTATHTAANTTTTASKLQSVEAQLAELCDLSKPPHSDRRDVLLRYAGHGQYMHYARLLAPMLPDISIGAHLPRASYRGAVLVRCRGRRLFLAPSTPEPEPQCSSSNNGGA